MLPIGGIPLGAYPLINKVKNEEESKENGGVKEVKEESRNMMVKETTATSKRKLDPVESERVEAC